MKITTKTIQLNKPENITTSFIEESFKNLNLEVIRWAIVEIQEATLVIDVAVVSN